MSRRRVPLYIVTLLIMLVFSGCGAMTGAQAPHLSAGIHTLTRVQAKSVTVSNSSTQPKPERLIIPAINVNTSVEAVEILADGNLATPARSPWDDVGWYDLGTSPGDRGSAVIDGHLDRPGGSPAVFWNLRNLQVGTDVLLINAQAKTLHFRVKQVAFYTPQEAPLQNIFGNTGGSYLNLITCAGDWIPSQHQTTLRLVVYTTLVN